MSDRDSIDRLQDQINAIAAKREADARREAEAAERAEARERERRDRRRPLAEAVMARSRALASQLSLARLGKEGLPVYEDDGPGLVVEAWLLEGGDLVVRKAIRFAGRRWRVQTAGDLAQLLDERHLEALAAALSPDQLLGRNLPASARTRPGDLDDRKPRRGR